MFLFLLTVLLYTFLHFNIFYISHNTREMNVFNYEFVPASTNHRRIPLLKFDVSLKLKLNLAQKSSIL